MIWVENLIMSNYLIVDISNIAHMCRHQNKGEDLETVSALTMHVMFQMLKKYYNKLKPTRIILAFDRANWRKEYTLSDKCVSGKIYKGDRNQNLTKSEQESLDYFRETLTNFEELITDYTGIITFSADRCEADDLIGRFCQTYGDDNKITILSSDKDYVQLLTTPNIKLMNPLQEKYRTLENYDYDVTWHKFIKFIRAGEDGIQSAFPRVRETRLRKAFSDDFERVNLMNEEWTNQDGKTFRVGDLYEENCLLMDLGLQPDDIKVLMDDTITKALANSGKYSHFRVLAFCGKYKLKNTAKFIDYLVPMLTNRAENINSGQFYS